MQEECKYGEKCLRLDCKYFHNIKKRSVPCVHFQNKGCFKGDRCPYLHIAKSSSKPQDTDINIDISPSIPSDSSLPIKRFLLDYPDPSKDLQDISTIIDQLDDHLAEPDKVLTTNTLKPLESRAPLISTLPQETETSIISQIQHKNLIAKTQARIERFLLPSPQIETFRTSDHLNDNTINVPHLTDPLIGSFSKAEDLDLEKSIFDKSNKGKIEALVEIKKVENSEAQDRNEKIIIEKSVLAGSNFVNLKVLDADRIKIDKVLDNPIFDSSQKPKVVTEELKLIDDKSESAVSDSKSGVKDIQTSAEHKRAAVKPVEDKSAEVRLNKTISLITQENTQINPKPIEAGKTSVIGKTLIERAVKPNRNEETLSLTPRKSPATEKITRILTLDEIKEKKRLEAQMKEIEKQAQNPPNNLNPIKTSAKTEIIEVRSELNLSKTHENKAKSPKIDSKLIKTENQPQALIPKTNPHAQDKHTGSIQIPAKRPPQYHPHPPSRQSKVQNNFPILVTAQEWEPYKHTLKSLDFSGLDLSQDDLQECLKLAEEISSPEGISKLIFDLEQTLSSKPDIKTDSEVESLSLAV